MTWNLAQTMSVIKAAQHKYTHRKMIGRDPKTNRIRYRYYYAEHHGGGITSANIEEGSAFKLTYKGRRGHFHVQRVEGDKVYVKHDGRPNAKEVEMTKGELRALLKRQHETIENKKREKAQANRRKGRKSAAKKKAAKKTPQEEPLKERLDPIEMKKMRGNLSFLRGQLEAMDINEKGQVKDPWATDRADPMYYQEPTPRQKQIIDDYKRTIDEIERRTQPQWYEKPSGLEAFKVALRPYVKGLKDITEGRGPRGNPVVTLVVGGGDREAFVARLKETYLGDGNRTYTISGPNNADFNVYLRDGEEALENIYLNLLNHQTAVSETEERPREKAPKKTAKKKAAKKKSAKNTQTQTPREQLTETAQAFSGLVDAIKSGEGTQAAQRAFKAALDKVIDKTESGTLTDTERAELLPIAEQLVAATTGGPRELMTAVRDQIKGSSDGVNLRLIEDPRQAEGFYIDDAREVERDTVEGFREKPDTGRYGRVEMVFSYYSGQTERSVSGADTYTQLLNTIKTAIYSKTTNDLERAYAVVSAKKNLDLLRASRMFRGMDKELQRNLTNKTNEEVIREASTGIVNPVQSDVQN